MVDNPGELRKGTYRTGSYCGRAARVKKNTSGSLWLDNFVRFAPCGFGFHRIPRSMSSGRQIHARPHPRHQPRRRPTGASGSRPRWRTRIWNFTASGRTVVRVL